MTNRAWWTGGMLLLSMIFLTGFLVNDGSDGQQIVTWGRPAGVAVTKDGALLVSDDDGNRIWRVRYTAGK